jgi:hypothetical protein
MNVRTWLTNATVWLLVAAPLTAAAQPAQSNDVTFRVPVNLTNLAPTISHIQVECRVASTAIPPSDSGSTVRTGRVTYPVTGGQFVQTVVVVVEIPALDNPAGKQANYSCELRGRANNSGMFETFRENHTNPDFRISPDPKLIGGTFDWVTVDATAPPPPASTTSPTGGN